MLPNFIVIGAGKSGTTTLYELLKEHPEVHMSAVKETNFFALWGKSLEGTSEDPKQLRHYPWSVTSPAAYSELFENTENAKARGEVSPMYLYNEDAPEAIKSTIPDVKLVVILRNPVDRLHSRYMHLLRENRQPAEDYKEVLDQDSIWWERNDLVREGFYNTYLQRYFQLFPPSQLRVYLYEDLQSNPTALMKDLYEFIGVDTDFQPHVSRQYNASGRIKNKNIDQLIGQNSVAKAWMNKCAPGLVKELKNSGWVKDRLLKLRKANLEKSPMPASTREQLIEKIYAPEITGLQQLIQRDLSHWLS